MIIMLTCSASFASEHGKLSMSNVAKELLQKKNGTSYNIVYEKQIKLDEKKLSKLPEHIQALARNQIERPSYYLLKTSDKASFYDVIATESMPPVESTSVKAGVRKTKSTVVNRIEELYYKDLINKKIYLKSDLNKEGKVVDYSTKGNIKWFFEKETKEIGGYEAKKASYIDNGVQVVAWYIPNLPISNGPEFYQGLPGLIVEVETDRVSLVMKEIQQTNESIDVPNFTVVQTLADYETELNRMRKPVEETTTNENGVIRKTRVIRSDM